MVKVELDRQEAEALVDSAIKSLSVEFDYFTDNALMCLALACGMIKQESDYKDWKENNILSIRSMHNDPDCDKIITLSQWNEIMACKKKRPPKK